MYTNYITGPPHVCLSITAANEKHKIQALKICMCKVFTYVVELTSTVINLSANSSNWERRR